LFFQKAVKTPHIHAPIAHKRTLMPLIIAPAFSGA
jgi:hypothetical protein